MVNLEYSLWQNIKATEDM